MKSVPKHGTRCRALSIYGEVKNVRFCATGYKKPRTLIEGNLDAYPPCEGVDWTQEAHWEDFDTIYPLEYFEAWRELTEDDREA